MKTALVCIAKDEDHYIEEWIDYHSKIGFDHIFIYQNNWTYNKSKKENTFWLKCDGQAMQLPAYNHFIINYSYNYKWIAFFDVDEFLVLNKHKNLKDFLEEYQDCNSIGINWAVFGDNNHKTVIDNNYKVLSRFTQRAKEDFISNRHIKTIMQTPCSYMVNPHYSSSPYWFNLNKERCTGPFNENVDWSVAQLNHYCTKSLQEMQYKISRGRADMINKRHPDELIKEAKCNEIEDLKALIFFNS